MFGFANLTLSTLQLLITYKLLFVLFFILILEFVLTLTKSKERYNTLISTTCKFSMQITLIKGIDI